MDIAQATERHRDRVRLALRLGLRAPLCCPSDARAAWGGPGGAVMGGRKEEQFWTILLLTLAILLGSGLFWLWVMAGKTPTVDGKSPYYRITEYDQGGGVRCFTAMTQGGSVIGFSCIKG